MEYAVKAKPKAIVQLLLKVLVTGVLLWWLSRYFNYQQIRESLREVAPGLILLAVGLHILSYLLGGVRWWLLFRHLAGPVSLRQIIGLIYLKNPTLMIKYTSMKKVQQQAKDSDQRKMDDVLRKMLSRPPQPAKKEKKKPA